MNIEMIQKFIKVVNLYFRCETNEQADQLRAMIEETGTHLVLDCGLSKEEIAEIVERS